MKNIPMTDYIKIAGRIIRRVRQRLRKMVAYREEPALQIGPELPKKASYYDPFYNLGILESDNTAGNLTNCQMDKKIYEIPDPS